MLLYFCCDNYISKIKTINLFIFIFDNYEQALAEALFKSARTSGIIDYRTVEGILGVSGESLTPIRRSSGNESNVLWCSPWKGPGRCTLFIHII